MRDGFVSHAAGGVLGGAMGTLFMMNGMKRVGRRLPERLKPTPVRRDPAELMVARMEALHGHPLPRRLHDGLASSLHWAYGIGWGGLLGLATARRPMRSPRDALLAGAALGTLVWAVGYAGWLPATHLTPPLHRQGSRHAATSLIAHVAYGVVSALPILALDRILRRERGWKRRLRALFR
jgi:hypothetical protein